MPTYDFKCTKCKNEWEEFFKSMNFKVPKCPICGALAKEIISAPVGFKFIGPGFYETDYKEKKKKDDL